MGMAGVRNGQGCQHEQHILTQTSMVSIHESSDRAIIRWYRPFILDRDEASVVTDHAILIVLSSTMLLDSIPRKHMPRSTTEHFMYDIQYIVRIGLAL